jgi:hypothetical protein
VPPVRTIRKAWLHPDHQLLLGCFGGIVEPWYEPENWTWLANQRKVLTEDACRIGVGWKGYYRDACELEGIPVVVDPTEYAGFAFEGNGDLTTYHLRTGRVVMFAHDHSFDHIDILEGCPDYTFYLHDSGLSRFSDLGRDCGAAMARRSQSIVRHLI